MSSFCYDLPITNMEGSADKINRRTTFAIFFDGTCNNRRNINAVEAVESGHANSDQSNAVSNYANDPTSSYNGDHTNVDKLQQAVMKNVNNLRSIYIEGSGTVDLHKDDKAMGTGFGCGSDGIRGKVKKACEKLAALIPEDARNVTIDVFGFSRGAAAARNFVYEITQDKGISAMYANKDEVDFQRYVPSTQSNKIPPKGFLGYYLKANHDFSRDQIINIKLKVRFVGLFDTVASYSPDSLIPKFESGAKMLSLHEIDKQAEKVVHLVAEDEHRANFAITPIYKGTTYVMPGVHSDIGGGYHDNAKEEVAIQTYRVVANAYLDNRDVAARDREIELMTSQKWYLPSQLTMKPFCPNEVDLSSSEMMLIGRRILKNCYSQVPLNIMVDNWIPTSHPTSKSGKLDIAKLVDVGSTVENEIKADLNTEINIFLSEFPQGFMAKNDNPIERFGKFKTLIDTFLERTYSPTDDELLYYFKSSIYRHLKFKLENSISILMNSNIVVFNNPNQMFGYTWAAEGYKFDQTMADALNDNRELLSNKIVEHIFLRILRNKYLHWSADYGSRVMVGIRTIAHPMKPNFNKNGQRERPIHSGK